jgi:hypothetical protein
MKKHTIIVSTLLITVILLTTSCKKDIINTTTQLDKSPATGSFLKNNKKIQVSTVEELYTAVNDPNNAGTTILIAPGTYTLNAGYPNGGRLELQSDMGLQGQPGQQDLVVIDQSALPASSYAGPTAITGGIRMGKGTNTLEWLTLKGGLLSVAAFAVVSTDLPSTESSITIKHVTIISNGSRIGIDIRNRLPEHVGRKITASVENSEVTGFVNSLGFAISVQNVNGASHSSTKLSLKENYIHGNRIGLLAGNGATSRTTENASIDIISHADRFVGNGVGLDPSGGVNSGATTFSNNNSTVIKLYGSTIADNNPPGRPELVPVNGALPGGVYAAAAYNTVAGVVGFNRASNNLLRMEFYGCDISNNNGLDINAVAAWAAASTLLAGTNNLLEIYLHGPNPGPTVNAVASIPAEPAGTNVINVYRN